MRIAIVVACAAQFLIGVDGLAVAIALPALRDDLGADPLDAQWVLTAYGVAFGGGLLLGGRLGDHYGRRRTLVWGMTAFAAGSLLAGAAPSLALLVGARVIQAGGAALAVPASLSLIGSVFPEGPARSRALAAMAAMAAAGTTSGLLLGGLVTELLGWRWVFLVIVAPALATALAAPAVLPEAGGERGRPDVPGALLATVGLVALLFGVTRVERSGLAAALPAAAAGVLLLAAFVAWERRAETPLVRFGILRVRSLTTATIGAAANAVAFTAIVFVATLYLQDELGYGPLEAGLALLPLDVVAILVSFVAPALVRGRSPRALLTTCFAVTALALLWLARAGDRYVVDLGLPLAVLGVSLCVAFVVLTHEAVAEVEPDEKGLASGIFETANHLFGGAVGVAVYATVMAAAGHGAAFAVAAGLAAAGALVATTARPAPA